MRTTVDLPEDILRLARELARDHRQTFSQAVIGLIRRGIEARGAAVVAPDPLTGFPTLRVGRPVTLEDVSSLEDEG